MHPVVKGAFLANVKTPSHVVFLSANCLLRSNGLSIQNLNNCDLRSRLLYSNANDPRPQMIPRPEMIPKLDRKWSRTANDPWCGPQMIPPKNKEWPGVCFHALFIHFIIIIQTINVKKDTYNVNCNLNIVLMINNSISFSLDNSSEKSRRKKVVNSNTISQLARSTTIIA